MEVGFHHIFRAPGPDYGGDQVHVQAHTSPGVYARAWLEGRLDIEQLRNFRRELAAEGGLPSYPHPRRMPDFWQMPCASMGLSTRPRSAAVVFLRIPVCGDVGFSAMSHLANECPAAHTLPGIARSSCLHPVERRDPGRGA